MFISCRFRRGHIHLRWHYDFWPVDFLLRWFPWSFSLVRRCTSRPAFRWKRRYMRLNTFWWSSSLPGTVISPSTDSSAADIWSMSTAITSCRTTKDVIIIKETKKLMLSQNWIHLCGVCVCVRACVSLWHCSQLELRCSHLRRIHPWQGKDHMDIYDRFYQSQLGS